MQDVFITKIHIVKVRHLENVEINLSDTERKHLILTGKNGSEKTSLLNAMSDKIKIIQEFQNYFPDSTVDGYNPAEYDLATFINNINLHVNIFYSQQEIYPLETFFAYIPVFRTNHINPKSIESIDIKDKTLINRNASKDFLRYIISLDYQLYSAKSDKNEEMESNLVKWFDNFLMALRDIYDCQELQLQRDAKNLTFNIKMPGHESFALYEMSDGYAAFLDIYMELLMRFEEGGAIVDYTMPAIVMIDEPEAHLHVELQKRALPFLVKMFPNVQFIVATHSPFIMTSLENAIVYDLEKNERLEGPSFYSYETVVESFLGTSTYSNELIRYFERYKELCFKNRTPDENEEFLNAKAELEIRSIPSTELYIAFQELEKKRKAAVNG